LEKICRLCLTIKKDMRNLFDDNIISMLEEFCSIKVRENDPLSNSSSLHNFHLSRPRKK
jgi:hypothetical protein